MSAWRITRVLSRQAARLDAKPLPRNEIASVRTSPLGPTPDLARKPIGSKSDTQSLQTDSNQFTLPSPTWHSASEHAAALLERMQGPGGRIGEVPAHELMKAHAEMCLEKYWEPAAWIPVAKAFRELLNDRTRRYASRNSRRFVVYFIPDPLLTVAPLTRSVVKGPAR